MKKQKTTTMVGVLLAAAAAHATGIVDIPSPSGGYSDPANPEDGITFGSSYSIAPSLFGLTVSAPEVRFDADIAFEGSGGIISGLIDGVGIQGYVTTFQTDSIELFNLNRTAASYLSTSDIAGDMTLRVWEGIRALYYLRVGDWWSGQKPRAELGYDSSGTYLAFGPGSVVFDTYLRRDTAGILNINGQNVVTQNVLANYVTLSGTQTLTNKSLDAGQITGSLTAAKGGTGLTSYTAGDLVYAASSSSLDKLPAVGSGNVLLSGSSPSWGKVGLATHVTGTLPVANGGTGATSLTGLLKGNGTGSVTTVAAPSGALVGTTDTQTLSNKTLSSPTVSGGITGDANGLALNAPTNKNITLTTSGGGQIVLNGSVSAEGLISGGVVTSVIDFSSNGLTDAIEYNPGNYLNIGTRYTLNLWGELGIYLIGNTVVQGSFAAGYGNTATGYLATAFGEDTSATVDNAAAFGFGSEASGISSLAVGDSVKAKGYASLATGQATVAKAYNAVAMGRFNVEQGNAATWVETDDLLTVGNGNPDAENGPVASNAMALHKDGKLRVSNVVDAKAGVRTPPMGDLGMGTFTAGQNPATLNAGLRYADE